MQGNGQLIASAMGDLGAGTERLVLFVQPRSKEDRVGYKTMLAKHFSIAAGFSKQGLVRSVSSASLFLRCSPVLLAARGQEFVPPPAPGTFMCCFWKEVCAMERESWSSFCRNDDLKRSFCH